MIDNRDLQMTIDRVQIQNVLARYCRGIDRLDREILREVYHPDANDDHGVFNGNAYEFIDMVLPLLKEITSGGSHMLFQSQIDVEGSRAAAETYFLAYQRMRGGRAKIEDYFGPTYADAATKAGTINEDHEYVAGGRYVDQLTRRNGEWRIQSRIVMNEWGQCGPLRNITDEGMIRHNIRLGSSDRSDPVYGAFAWLREPAQPETIIA